MRDLSRTMSTIPGFTFLGNFPLEIFKKVRIPGLDVVLGVTVYQIAEMARVAATATIKSRKVTEKMAERMRININHISGRSRRKILTHGVEITKHTTRGAMHVTDEKQIRVETLTDRVIRGVITASTQAGISAEDTVLGTSQGIVQGAVETGVDVTTAVKTALKAVINSAEELGISEDDALTIAVKGTLHTAEGFGPEVVAHVVKAIPDENLPKSIVAE